jgi:hypothetical protein
VHLSAPSPDAFVEIVKAFGVAIPDNYTFFTIVFVLRVLSRRTRFSLPSQLPTSD